MAKETAKDILRNEYLNFVSKALADNGEEVLEIASNAFCFPVVDKEGNDLFVRIKVEIPTGSKDEPFDGYALQEDYKIHLAEKAEKAKANAEKKARKIEKDKKQRALSEKIKSEKAKAKA